MNHSEQEFVAAGAECVAGDLILNRVVVGRYRGGVYIPSEEGMLMDLPKAQPAHAALPSTTDTPPASAVKPGRKPKAPKAEAPAPVEPALPASDPLADLGALGLPE